MKMLLVLLLLISSASFINADVFISSVGDFKNFVNSVNSGTSYSGTTVFLGFDLSLSEINEPIGINETYQFNGVFDGEGYVISDLTINASLQYTGLFGYSTGLTIKNVVLDSSCTITSSYNGSKGVYLGKLIGYCWANSSECNIENSVNMASVIFSGSISDENNILFIGGIAGYLFSSSDYNVNVMNCVNYGSVTHSGTVSTTACLGGIVGYSYGSTTYYNYIQNCLNYGTTTHSGTSTDLAIGGIVGYGQNTYIENCVSSGKIFTYTTASGNNSIGSTVGKVESDIYINYCYYTSDVNTSSINGTGTLNSTTGTPTSPTDVDSELVKKLNNNATSCNWSKWFVLHLNGGNINNLTQNLLVGIQGQIPNPAKEGNSFLFWCKDAECIDEFDPKSVGGITDLYVAWTNNTVTFDFGNGTTTNVTFSYNTEIAYPDMKKEGYTLSWDNYHELMPARDIIVTAQLTPNNYTVTFDANDGNVSETSIIVTFDKKYGKLPEPNRTGHIFLGWFTNEINGTEVTNETIVTTSRNHTLYAHWEEVIIQVKIVFNTKDLTEEDVEKLIEQYTKAGFTITKFEKNGGSDEINVIIGFVDKKAAENFIENIKGSDEMKNIKKINFVDDDGSISTTTYPLLFLNFLFL